MPSPWLETLRHDGIAVVPNVLTDAQIEDLIARLDVEGGRGGNRHTDQDPAVREHAWTGSAMALAREALGEEVRPVRILFFDKNPEANWSVPYHQDLTIAVQTRAEVEGFRSWTVKAGIPHVQAPASLLEAMVAVRLHLDACGGANGPLRVLPGTHREGKLSHAQIEDRQKRLPEVAVTAGQGAAILMHPLLLHASSPAAEPSHRRVLHIEYAASDLPAPLEWNLR